MNITRKAIYSKNGNTRIVSVSNGLWQLQSHEGKGKGRNYQKAAKGVTPQDHYDPWFKRGEPGTRDEALRHFAAEDKIAAGLVATA